MPIPHPNFTAALQAFSGGQRLKARRRLQHCANKRAGYLLARFGQERAVEAARTTLMRYAAAPDGNRLSRLRHAMASRVYSILRSYQDKPVGLSGYEASGE